MSFTANSMRLGIASGLLFRGLVLGGIVLGLAGFSSAQQPPDPQPGSPPAAASQERPYLGAFIKDTDDEQSRALGVTATSGAVITRTTTRSPAKQAGLVPGDVITAMEGQPIVNAISFYRAFSKFQPDQNITVTIQRGAETLNVPVTLTAQKSPPPAGRMTPATEPTPVPLAKPSPGADTSVAGSVTYQHPENVYQLRLPAGWQISYGMRGRLRAAGFDTLQDAAGRCFLICPHEPWPKLAGLDGLNAFRREQLAALATHDDVTATAYSVGELAWMEISYRLPESGQRLARLATLAPDEHCFAFDLIGSAELEPQAFAAVLVQLQQGLSFSGNSQKPNSSLPTAKSEPPAKAIPADAFRLENLLDGQARVVGLSAVSAGQPKAVELGIETFAGAVVTEVHPNTPAAQVGMRARDVIVRFGEHDIQTLEDCQAAIWTSPLNSVQPVVAVRGNTRLNFQLRIAPDATQRLSLQEYRHPSGGYRFEFLPRWKLSANARREQVSGRLYDLLESEYGGYEIHLFRDRQLTSTPIETLESFLKEQGSLQLEGRQGWCLVNNQPLVYVSGTVGRERLFTLYRIAFMQDQYLYELNAFTPPLNDPETLPLVLQTMLGSLRK